MKCDATARSSEEVGAQGDGIGILGMLQVAEIDYAAGGAAGPLHDEHLQAVSVGRAGARQAHVRARLPPGRLPRTSGSAARKARRTHRAVDRLR